MRWSMRAARIAICCWSGVNSRDLVTLKVVPGRLDELAASLPASVKRVAESGVATADDAARMASCGYDLALVGSALMSAPDPAALASAMLTAARAAREGCDAPTVHQDLRHDDARRGQRRARLRGGCDRLRVRAVRAPGDSRRSPASSRRRRAARSPASRSRAIRRAPRSKKSCATSGPTSCRPTSRTSKRSRCRRSSACCPSCGRAFRQLARCRGACCSKAR